MTNSTNAAWSQALLFDTTQASLIGHNVPVVQPIEHGKLWAYHLDEDESLSIKWSWKGDTALIRLNGAVCIRVALPSDNTTLMGTWLASIDNAAELLEVMGCDCHNIPNELIAKCSYPALVDLTDGWGLIQEIAYQQGWDIFQRSVDDLIGLSERYSEYDSVEEYVRSSGAYPEVPEFLLDAVNWNNLEPEDLQAEHPDLIVTSDGRIYAD